jgi:murein DD-endopeptidase
MAPEIVAVDYIGVVTGRVFGGDGAQNGDWFGYGAPIRAVAGGRVVAVVNDRPEIPPGEGVAGDRTVTKPSDFGGNYVGVEFRSGVFANYEHLQAGSIRVKVGQRVRTGQQLGRHGNGGNASGPDLYFGIDDGRDPLGSDSLSFEIDRFRFESTAAAGPTPGELTVTGKPHDAPPGASAHPPRSATTRAEEGRLSACWRSFARMV